MEPSYYTQDVKLADGKTLKTCGTVKLLVKFGYYWYHGIFYVLKVNVPNILGITFFRDVKPTVDWSDSQVWI